MVSGIREPDEQLSCEITEEMIEADRTRLWLYPDYADSDLTVREVFLAMMAARCREAGSAS
jgi:RNA-binding protein YlmH